jgi:signal transduction histidine kinase
MTNVDRTATEPGPVSVLLIEDNPGDARLIREMLSDDPSANVELEWEQTLASGLARARRGGICAVLLDLTLPDGSGVATLHEALQEMPHMPVVVLTGMDDDELAGRAMRDGAQDYLVKGHADGPAIARSVRYAIERARAEALRARTERELEEYRGRLEDMVNERTADLLAANERLTAALATRARFLASVSHELRTPLNSIIGFGQLLRSETPGALNDEQLRQLEMLNASSQHLLGIVNQILELTRIEGGREEFTITSFDPCEVAALVVESMAPLAEARGDTIVLEIGGCAHEMLGSDESKIRQVLLNLVGNAVKYTEGGTVTVSVTTAGRLVYYTVSDTGRGIPPEALDRVFVEFERGDVMDHREGVGLGLAISRSLARALGGEVSVQSELGVGSTFAFWVPEFERSVQDRGSRAGTGP